MDCQATERDGKPVVEFTRDGNDETEHVFGRGCAVLEGDQLEGMIIFHFGGDSGFTAGRAEQKSVRKRK